METQMPGTTVNSNSKLKWIIISIIVVLIILGGAITADKMGLISGNMSGKYEEKANYMFDAEGNPTESYDLSEIDL